MERYDQRSRCAAAVSPVIALNLAVSASTWPRDGDQPLLPILHLPKRFFQQLQYSLSGCQMLDACPELVEGFASPLASPMPDCSTQKIGGQWVKSLHAPSLFAPFAGIITSFCRKCVYNNRTVWYTGSIRWTAECSREEVPWPLQR